MESSQNQTGREREASEVLSPNESRRSGGIRPGSPFNAVLGKHTEYYRPPSDYGRVLGR